MSNNIVFELEKAFQEDIFRKVTKRELFHLREEAIRSKKSGFVLKLDDEYYYSIWPNQKLVKILDSDFFTQHCCSKGNGKNCDKKDRTCKRSEALPEERGGCRKVFDRFYSFNGGEMSTSKMIEKYDFIRCGYEIFGSTELLTVLYCQNYEVSTGCHHYSKEEIKRFKKLLEGW